MSNTTRESLSDYEIMTAKNLEIPLKESRRKAHSSTKRDTPIEMMMIADLSS